MNPDAAIMIAVDATCYCMKFFIDNSDGDDGLGELASVRDWSSDL